MKVKFNKIIAIALAVAMVVIGVNYTPNNKVKADDEYTPVTDNWVTVGNFQIFKGYDGRSMSYSGTGAYNDMKIKMSGTTNEEWATQIGIDLSGLEVGTTYNYEIVFDSNNATTIFDQVPGLNGVTRTDNISVVAGENTISGSFVAGTNPANGNIMLFPRSAPDGTIFDFKSVTVTEVETPTVAADWVAVPASNNQYYYDDANKINIASVVDVQKPGFADESGIYVTVPQGISTVTINGLAQTTGIQGAGVVLYLSNMTQEYNNVVIHHGQGVSKITIKKVTGQETSTSQVVSSTQVTTTAPVVTTTAPVVTTTANPAEQPINVTGLTAIPELGSIHVSWTVPNNAPTGQVYDIYLDNEAVARASNVTANTVDITGVAEGTHSVKVVSRLGGATSSGVIADEISVEEASNNELKPYNPSDLKVEGFQIKTNGTDNDVAFRTVCKAPKIGESLQVTGGNSYTVKAYGVIYTLDTNLTGLNRRNVLSKSYTILNETQVSAGVYNGLYQYQGNNRTVGYEATSVGVYDGWNPIDTNHTYYVRTMTEAKSLMANTLHVRAFAICDNGGVDVFVYSDDAATICVAEVADYLYKECKAKNYQAHNYLYNTILHTDALRTVSNKYYRANPVEYGWNGNLYSPQDVYDFSNHN